MIGQTVSQYRILEEIGRGGMGIVFKAQDTFLGRFVALKILVEELVNDPEILFRFEREGGSASALNHPNICSVFETGSWQGRPYLAMELLTGQTLDDRLAAGLLPTSQLIEIAVGVTSALEATHAIGVVHRDIKPGNLFLTNTGQVKPPGFRFSQGEASSLSAWVTTPLRPPCASRAKAQSWARRPTCHPSKSVANHWTGAPTSTRSVSCYTNWPQERCQSADHKVSQRYPRY
jgi:serine/threonine protein kinase